MNSAGRTSIISGKRIFTGTFCACSSARCRRRVRISPACSASTPEIGTPSASAWTIAATKCCTSCALTRSTSAWNASRRVLPICISWSTRWNSPASGPVVFRATWERAASNPRPAWMLITRRSTVSARSFWIRSWRLSPTLWSSRSGRKNPAAPKAAPPTTIHSGEALPMTAPSTPSESRPAPLPAKIRSRVHRGGLPARSRRRASAAVVPFPESARASRTAALPAGSSTRVWNGIAATATREPEDRPNRCTSALLRAAVARAVRWVSRAATPSSSARNTAPSPPPRSNAEEFTAPPSRSCSSRPSRGRASPCPR